MRVLYSGNTTACQVVATGSIPVTRSQIMKKKIVIFSLIALTDYQLAKFGQRLILTAFPSFSYVWSLSLPWLAIGILPVIFARQFGMFSLDISLMKRHFKALLVYCALVLAGLALFASLRITSYFHSVQYPFIFFIITPIVEELIFRGWIYDMSKKHIHISPVLITAILFGLNHWQYFGFRITLFAVFQIGYTFVLGLLLGKMREKSGNIYFSTVVHSVINYATLML